MLRQIKADADALRLTLTCLRNGTTKIEANGEWLQGAKLEALLATTAAGLQEKLDDLDLILQAGIIPDKYISMSHNKTYYPSPEELKQKETQALPQGKYSFFCQKEKRKPEGLQHSQIKLIRDDGSQVISFFMEHNKDAYPIGGFSKVKKGSLSETKVEPKYAIKIYKKDNFGGDKTHELRIAMIAAYCYGQLGRQGYTYRRNDKQYMVTEWIDGPTLEDADQKEVQSMPIARRIVMAISLLRELNVLHKQGLIHHDIKPSNVKINFGKLCFVDLDSVSLKNAKPMYGRTPIHTSSLLPSAQMVFDTMYTNNAYLKFNETTDLYALAITLSYLFEEIYKPKLIKQVVTVNGQAPVKSFDFYPLLVVRGPNADEHPQLLELLMNMIFGKDKQLASCEDYIEALQKILKTYPDYEKYIAEDRLVNLGKDLTAEDGKKAFKEIEMELLGFNQRVDYAAHRVKI